MRNFLLFLLLTVSQVALANSYVTTHGAVDQADYTTISKGTKQLVATSNQVQFFASGDNADFHILQLSDATHLPQDWWLRVVNNSNGFITVRNSNGTNIASVNSSRIGIFSLQSNGTTGGTWNFNTPAAVADIITDHGQLSGLGDDDHPQYHNDARGDARYFRANQFIASSNGVPDAGLPVKTNGSGQVDDTFLPNSISSDITGNAATATALQNAPSQCAAGQVATGINADGSANCSAGGAGDVTGPGSSTDRAVAIFSGTGGKTLQNSTVIVDATGNVAAVGFTGALDGNATTAGSFDHTPTKCSAGNYPLGIDALGNAQSCTAAASGSGDVSSNTSSSVDGEVALFSGTGGKTIKRATGSGLAKLTSGVLGTATSGTDYAPATSGSSILYGNGAGGFSNVTVGTGLSFVGGTLTSTVSGTVTTVSVASANGFAGTVANATTTPAITLSTTITGLLKGNGTAISAATSGTDYAPATSGSSILYGNGAGGFSSVTVGTGLSFAGGTLSATGTSSPTYAYFYMDTGNGHGSTNTKVRRYSNIRDNIGSVFTITQSSTNGDKVSVGSSGTYVFCQGDVGSAGPVHSGLVLNGANGTTDLFTLTYAQGQRTGGKTNGTNSSMGCWASPLSANDYVWVQTNAAPDSTSTTAWFTGAKVSDASEPIIFLQNGSGHGSTATKLRTFTNARVSSGGSYLSLTQSATNGDKISVLLPAKFLICYGDGNSAGSGQGAITINDQAVTTNASSSSLINGIRTYNGGPTLAGGSTQNCYSDWLVTGDVIAFHDDGASDATDGSSYAFVTKMGTTDPSMQYYTIGSSHGSTNTKARTYSKEWKRLSSNLNGTKDAVDGDTQWTGAEGIYFACANDQISAGTPSMGFSIKDPVTTSATSLSYANGLRGVFTTGVNNTNSNLCAPIYLPAGGRIFPIDNGTNSSADFRSYFTSSRLY